MGSHSGIADRRRLGSRLRGHFVASEVLDAQEASRAARAAGFDCCSEIEDRRPVQLTGFVSSVVVPPPSAPQSVEVDVFDGTGTVTAIWLGQDRISGIRPGTRLVLDGTAARRGRQRVMYNPRYEILGLPGEEES
ncbi:OB-fold nucleic acid binding domain-containing protein [Brachybacterium sp. JHP9]|uniref:OB-fold nucleic acid binding domain-containing protein n=1 Tax=Brachybacterium equifaecis TaxID=2910770 RepID=A0ABT0R0K2_9MICO|nr:OB-fold nucleic acid binding domain-containing protein [Brachybacterium equifaecis]MCL6423448.1 OB-fold nucleic acid binding domain-containing protein [Brachybacterium equifaecis]